MKLSEIQAQGGTINPIKKLSGILPAALKPGEFRYRGLPKQEETREQKMSRLQADAAAAKKESDDANSVLGFAKNFGKAFVSTIAPSEVGLGETISKISQDPRKIAENIAPLQEKQVQLLKAIREKEARGEDTTKMKQIYNSNADFIKGQRGEIDKYNAELPSTGKVLGQLGGVALDIGTAGVYGKAAAGMKTGVLGSAVIPSAVRTVAGPGIARGLGSLSGLRRIGTGAAIGYASDVTRGLQGDRGKEREGGAAFIPGLGTALGAGIPAALEAEQSVIHGSKVLGGMFDRDTFINKRTGQFEEAINSTLPTKRLGQKINAKGNDVARLLASDDRFVPTVADGRIQADKAVANVQDQIDPLAKIVRAVIEDDNKAARIDDIKKLALDEIDDLQLRGAEYDRVKNNILADIDFYAQKFGQQQGDDIVIPLKTIDDIKIAKYKNINWNNPEMLTTDRAVARAARKTIERSITDVDVRALNKELGKFYDAQEMLEALNGRTVKGGRLGKGFARLLGLGIGSHGGPAGAVVGTVTADKVADIMQTGYFDNPVVKKALGDIQRESPEIFAQAQEVLAARAAERGGRLTLPAGAPGLPAINQGRPIPVFPAAKDNLTDYIGKDTAIVPKATEPIHVYGNDADFLGAHNFVNDKTAIPPATGPLGAANVRTVNQLANEDALQKGLKAVPFDEMDGAMRVEFVKKTINDHLQEAQDVVKELPADYFKKDGGMTGLIERLKTNIADGLKAEGAIDAAEVIRKLSTKGYNTIEDFAAALTRIAGK